MSILTSAEVMEFTTDLVKVPGFKDIVYKDECFYCFKNAESEGGLFVCLKSWKCFCKCHFYQILTAVEKCLFLNIIIINSSSMKEKKLTELVINENEYKPEPIYNILYLSKQSGIEIKSYNSDYFPKILNDCVNEILKKSSTQVQTSVEAWKDEDIRPESKHSKNLFQLPAFQAGHIDFDKAKCAKCDIKDNLWFNLTDGSILCGRKYFDGSGGNNHAIEHYEETKYPLAVKIGTISSAGADVYSYEEDMMVTDSNLKIHLDHFGINIAKMVQNQKNMKELELKYNSELLSSTMSANCMNELTYASGPGLIGIANLGNSCYMSVALQVIASIPEFSSLFSGDICEKYSVFDEKLISDPLFQLHKLMNALESEEYSVSFDSNKKAVSNIKPYALKLALCKNSVFSNEEQNDSFEFFLYLINKLSELSQKEGFPDISRLFQFRSHFTVTDVSNNEEMFVSFENTFFTSLDLSSEFIMGQGTDQAGAHIPEQVSNESHPCFKWETSKRSLLREEKVKHEGILTHIKRTKFATYPNYLVIKVNRYLIDDNRNVTKSNVEIEIPEFIDLSFCASSLPEITPKKEIDQSIVNELLNFGFEKVICENAVYQNKGKSVEFLVNWILSNQEVPVTCANKDVTINVDETQLENLISMGFDRDTSVCALQASGDFESALNMILSGEIVAPPSVSSQKGTNQNETNSEISSTVNFDVKLEPGQSMNYQLFAFVSHVGNDTSFGHYICHIKKNHQWFLFNDSRVAIPKAPPLNTGYLYFFKRFSS